MQVSAQGQSDQQVQGYESRKRTSGQHVDEDGKVTKYTKATTSATETKSSPPPRPGSSGSSFETTTRSETTWTWTGPDSQPDPNLGDPELDQSVGLPGLSTSDVASASESKVINTVPIESVQILHIGWQESCYSSDGLVIVCASRTFIIDIGLAFDGVGTCRGTCREPLSSPGQRAVYRHTDSIIGC